MRAAILTSNKRRHAYLAQRVASAFDVGLLIREDKGSYYADAGEPSPLVAEHFRRLDDAEASYFGTLRWPDVPVRDLAKSAVNDEAHVRAAREAGTEVVFLFGTSILGDGWLAAFEDRIINLHLGLSPFYRGSATLFWPVARGEIECVGATIHLAERRVDAGRILARVKPRLDVGDSYYDITNKTIRDAIDALPGVARRYLDGTLEPAEQGPGEGAPFRKRDFTEAALRDALAVVGTGLTAAQIARIVSSGRCAC